MSPKDSKYTPLTSLEKEALNHLYSNFGSDESFTYNQAYRCLQKHEMEQLLAEDLLEALLLRGYLYKVNGNLRITS